MMNLLNQNNGIFSNQRKNKGPSIISRKSIDGINEINMIYEDVSTEEVGKLLANYGISKYSLNEGIYVFKINSDNELLDNFVRDAYSGPLGRNGNYPVLRGIQGYKDSDRFKDEAEGFNLESHISYDNNFMAVSAKPLIKKSENNLDTSVKVIPVEEKEKKYFSEEEVMKMQKTNSGLKYIIGTLAVIVTANIGGIFYLHNKINNNINELDAKLNATRKQVQTYKVDENKHYSDLNSNLVLTTNKLSENMVEINNNLTAKLKDTNELIEKLKYDNVVNMDKLDLKYKKRNLALVEVIESNNEHYDTITTNLIKADENLNINLEEKTNELLVQIEDVKNQKLTSPWYLIKTGFSNAYHALANWNKDQAEKVKEFEKTHDKKD